MKVGILVVFGIFLVMPLFFAQADHSSDSYMQNTSLTGNMVANSNASNETPLAYLMTMEEFLESQNETQETSLKMGLKEIKDYGSVQCSSSPCTIGSGPYTIWWYYYRTGSLGPTSPSFTTITLSKSCLQLTADITDMKIGFDGLGGYPSGDLYIYLDDGDKSMIGPDCIAVRYSNDRKLVVALPQSDGTGSWKTYITSKIPLSEFGEYDSFPEDKFFSNADINCEIGCEWGSISYNLCYCGCPDISGRSCRTKIGNKYSYYLDFESTGWWGAWKIKNTYFYLLKRSYNYVTPLVTFSVPVSKINSAQLVFDVSGHDPGFLESQGDLEVFVFDSNANQLGKIFDRVISGSATKRITIESKKLNIDYLRDAGIIFGFTKTISSEYTISNVRIEYDVEECTYGPCCDTAKEKFKPYGSQPTGYTDSYFCSGTNSPTGTNYVKYGDYYCTGTDADMHYSESTQDTCGTCSYCQDGYSTCKNYDSSTSCGTCRRCNGAGSCSSTPSDDSGCGTIDCSNWYVQTGVESPTATEYCYNKKDITSSRCEGLGNCKDSNTADCSSQANDQLKYSCGLCKYMSSSACTGTTLGGCSNYFAGIPCGTNKECDGNGNCVRVDPYEPNDNFDTSYLITEGAYSAGFISPISDLDYYKISLNSNSLVEYELNCPSAKCGFTGYRNDKTQDFNIPVGFTWQKTTRMYPAGNAYLKAFGNGVSDGISYSFSLDISPCECSSGVCCDGCSYRKESDNSRCSETDFCSDDDLCSYKICDGTGSGILACSIPRGCTDCGNKDCDYNDYYFIDGTNSPTETSYCKYRDYIDFCNRPCDSATCQDCSCDVSTASTKNTAGLCQYIDGCSGSTSGTVKNYPKGTSCGSGKECDGNGNCIAACTDECSTGQTRCLGNIKQTCDDYDADDCLEWPSSTSGPGNEECVYECRDGHCALLEGDVNGDYTVNIFDLAAVGLCYGQSASGDCQKADLSGNGVIDIFDLATVGLNYGRSY